MTVQVDRLHCQRFPWQQVHCVVFLTVALTRRPRTQSRTVAQPVAVNLNLRFTAVTAAASQKLQNKKQIERSHFFATDTKSEGVATRNQPPAAAPELFRG